MFKTFLVGAALCAFFQGGASLLPTASAEERSEVSLLKKGGVYTVPVLINGIIPLQFIVDSGAADISLPADVFLTLLRTGTIGKDDFVGNAHYQLADGSTVESDRFLLHELKVGNHVLSNVLASIESVNSTPLLGQSFLSKFSSWSLDNDRHVITLVSRGRGEAFPVISKSSPSETTTMALNSPNGARQQSAVLCGRSVDYVLDTARGGDYAVFLGVWTGTWSNPSRLCGGLIVERIRPDGSAQAVYAYGSGKMAWRQQQVTGSIQAGRFTFQDDQASTFSFDMKFETQLGAVFKGASGRLIATFEKQ
jgi:gag-polyprotein putative aspartyl protease